MRLILMGTQPRQAIAIEIIGVLVVVEIVLYRSTFEALNAANTSVVLRALGSFATLVIEQIGAVILFIGPSWGLYVVAVGMISSFVFMVTGAWLLLVGVQPDSGQPSMTPESGRSAGGGEPSVTH